MTKRSADRPASTTGGPSSPSRRAFAGTVTGLAVGAALAGTAVVMPGAAAAKTPANLLVVANRIDDITTMDPAQSFEFSGSDVIRNLYENLVGFDPADLDAGYKPELAESWEVSEDGLSITFTMADGPTFASGAKVTAADAEFSLRRVVALGQTPSFILTQFGFTPENVERTIVADGNTLTLTLDQAYAESFVLNCLGATIGAVVDMETVMEHETDGDMGNAWLATNSAGSGPYALVAWKPSESVTMTANENHAGEAPAMKRVIVQHIQESATQRLLLEKGDVDAARNLNPEDIAGIAGDDALKVEDVLRGRLMYLALNQKNEALANPKIVEAMKYLVDYEGMTQSFLKGQYAIHQTFVPETYFGAIDDAPYGLDVEKAKALVAESGVSADALSFDVAVRDAQERIEAAQSLQNTFGQAGITLNVTVATGKQVLTRYRAREYDITLETWGPDYPDPQTNAGTFAFNPDNSDEAQATGLLAYRAAYDPGELGPQVEAAVLEKDEDKRKDMYGALQREFLDSAPFVIMYQQIEQLAMRKEVEGLSLGEAITAAAYWKVTK